MIDDTPMFSKCHCGGAKHLVALSGAHTIGQEPIYDKIVLTPTTFIHTPPTF
jgi:hypothetical protein